MGILALLIDTCSLVNLHNCGHLKVVCQIVPLRVSPIVLGECSALCAAEIIDLAQNGNVAFVPDDQIDADRYLDLVGQYDIGNGEIEALVVCEAHSESFCSDDGAARKLGRELLGEGKICGSLALLKRAVEAELLSCEVAFGGYGRMVQEGAWLPPLERDYFCQSVGC
jgi:predicted nucleic acid-binding protein